MIPEQRSPTPRHYGHLTTLAVWAGIVAACVAFRVGVLGIFGII